MDLLQTLIKNLERGKESAQQMRSLLQVLQGSDGGGGSGGGGGGDNHDHHHCYKWFDDHSLVVLSSLDTALSLLQSNDFNGDLTTAKKDDFPHHCKSEEESGGETPKNAATAAAAAAAKDRRGSYKRRKIGQSVTMDTPNLTDDGFAWRKYGQKTILNAQHPRNYYRCTHKIDQGCQATKQVQQISENPTKYRIIYHGRHTCNNFHKNLPILLDSPEQDSSLLLSFGANTTTAKHALNPFIITSSSAFASAMVKQEYGSIEEEMMPSGPSDPHHGINQYSPSSDYLSPSSDLTTTGLSSTPASDQGDVISSAEVYSSTASPHGMEEADYSYIMADDSISLDAVLQDMLFVVDHDEVFLA